MTATPMQGGLGEECLVRNGIIFHPHCKPISYFRPSDFRIFAPRNLDIGNAHETELMALSARWSAR